MVLNISQIVVIYKKPFYLLQQILTEGVSRLWFPRQKYCIFCTIFNITKQLVPVLDSDWSIAVLFMIKHGYDRFNQ